MKVNDIVFLVNKQTRQVLLAGKVPKVYGSITGLSEVDYAVLKDLGAHFPDDKNTYANLGFLIEADAIAAGVSVSDIERAKAGAFELEWARLEEERFNRIEDQQWRVDRYNNQVAMGIPPTEDILPVLEYMQEIRDLPQTRPNPFVMVWPAVPA
jgi:hypothetical protein